MLGIFLFTSLSFAHDNVVVVPLNTKRAAPGSVFISGSDFHRNPDPTETFTYDANGGKLHQTSGTQRFFAPIQFPQGVTLTKLTQYSYDPDNSYYVSVSLNRSTPSSYTTGETIFIVNSLGNSGNQTREETVPIAGREVVDNTTYSYIVIAYFSGGVKSLYGVRIDYE